jgi:hypothetical protein
MNPQVKDLMGRTLDKKFSHTWTALNYQDLEIFSEYLAELIVRECIRECKQEWYDTNNDPELNAETDTRMIGIKIGIKQGSLKCISRIKEHFGVAE